MHDPMTLAWEIKYPWKRKTAHGSYRDSFLMVWHTDPCIDGSDDSCGWFSPRLTLGQKDMCRQIADDMSHDVFKKQEENGRYCLRVSGESAVFTAYLRVGWRMFNRQKLSHRHIECVLGLMHNRGDSLVPYGRDMDPWDISQFVCLVAREFARIERPWWRHPRYHVRHLKVNVPLIMKFKRYIFSRCSKCGRGFSWGYAPTSASWDGVGPRWFRGEPGVHHHDCGKPKWNGASCGKSKV